MRQALFALGLTLLLLAGCASSAPSAKSPARILNGVFSNAASVFMKWLWSLKTTNTRTVSVHRPLVKFESGYSVETVFDGSKLGIEPYSVQVLQSGELLILDSENSNVYRISTPLSLYSRPKLVAGSPEGSSGHVDGRPREAKLNHPKGMAVDDKGNIYIADTDNMAIRKISESGVTTIVGGRSPRGGGHVAGPGEDAKLSNDFDIVYVGSSCSLLVVDRGNRAIREIHLHFDDCAYQYGTGFPYGIGVVIAAGILGYILASLRQPAFTDSNAYCEYTQTATDLKQQSGGFLSHIANIFAWVQEIVSRLVPGFTKTSASKTQLQSQLQSSRQQQNSYSYGWPEQQDSFEFPADEPPPPPDTREPTPKKTYAFMSKDSEKMNQMRQSRVFYNAWANSEQPRPQLRIQQAAATFDSQSSQHPPSSDKKAAKEQDRDRPRRRKSAPKTEDHVSPGQNPANVAPPADLFRYQY